MKNNLAKFFRGKKVLVTGHSGFKGGWLTQILLDWGAKVVGISLVPSTKPCLFDALNIKKQVVNYFVDIRGFKEIRKIIAKEKPEIVFHLAAQPIVRESYNDPLYTFETNIMGTANVLQALKDVGCAKAAVFITTDKVYENKETDCFYKENDSLGGYDSYSASKAAAEIVISSYINSFFNPQSYGQGHQTLIASARAGNVVGGGDWAKDRIVTDIIRSVFEKKEKIIMRNPKAVRPWQFVLEPLHGYLLLAKNLYDGKKNFSGAWNFGPNYKNCLPVEDLVKRALEILNKKNYFLIKKDKTRHEAQLLKLNSNKAQKMLKWRPVLNFAQTLDFTFEWYKNFYRGGDSIKFTRKQIKSFFNQL